MEDTYLDNGEPNLNDPWDRRNFKAIRKITRKSLEALVLRLVQPNSNFSLCTCHVTLRKEGSYNHAVFLDVRSANELKQEYVIKIPAHGTPKTWKTGDSIMLANEAKLVRHVRYHTSCPVPEIVAFDETTNNAIGAPFILMEKMQGNQATYMWNEYSIADSEMQHPCVDADEPSPEIEEKRVRFLHSLAQAMSKLRTLKYSQVGIPSIPRPESLQPSQFYPVYRWYTQTIFHPLLPMGPFHGMEDFFTFQLDLAWGPRRNEVEDLNDLKFLKGKGVRKVLDIIFSLPPFTIPRLTHPEDTEASSPIFVPPEHFVLRHFGLDLQNILVDDRGVVTGILGWDQIMAVPRCVDYSNLPIFLHRDWLQDDIIDMWPHMS